MGLCRVMVILVVGLTLSLAGCSGDDQPGEETQPSESTEPVLPDPIAAEGAKRVDLEDRLVSEIRITDGPDWMATGFGSLWVKRDNGSVDRVDPRSGKVIAAISPGPFKPPVCQGIGITEDAVWACPGRDELIRIDPGGNSVTGRLNVDKVPDQGRLIDAGGRLWVITDSGKTLSAIEPNGDSATPELKLPGCTDLARSQGDALWVLCPLADRVLKVDAAAGEIVDQLELGDARTAALGEDLWVGFEGGVAQIDTDTLDVIATYELYPRYGGAIFATNDAVWVREEGGPFLTRIDPVGQRVVETIEAPQIRSGGDVIVIGDSVWATAFDDDVLVQLSAH